MHFPPIPRREVLIAKIRAGVLINDQKNKLITIQALTPLSICRLENYQRRFFLSASSNGL
jgi:hypothetical protein